MTFDTRGAAVIVLALAVGVAILVGVAKRFVVLSLGWRILLGVWILLELTFFAVQRLRYRRFNRRNTNVPRAHLKDIRKRFDDFLTLAPVLDLREFLSGWFLGIAADSIRQDNLSEFLSYAYWFQPFEELSEEDQQVVRSFNQQLQTTFNVQFPEGSNPDLQLMQHLWEPLRVVHKPLVLHLVSEMSTCCTHALLQALRFERHEFMGFTYWAHGLQPLAPEEVPAGSRKLTALQSLFVDLHSLLNSDDQGGPGPMDFISAQAQGIAEYQKRLRATLNDVMMPPTFEDSFNEGTSTTLLPDISATLAAFSEHMPSVPIPQLPRLPTMTSSRPPTGEHHPSQSDLGIRNASTAGLSLPRVLSMPSLSGLYAFRDLARDGISNFEDFESSLATGLPSLTRNVRQTVSEWSSQAAAVQAALVAALPVLNLPDWRLGTSSIGSDGGEVLPWQERVGAAATRVVQQMELDKLFEMALATVVARVQARVFQESCSLDDAGLAVEPGAARGAGGPSRAASESLPGSPLSQQSTSFMEEWVRSASRAAHGGHRIIARFSGFSMPTPSQLLPPSLSRPLWAAFGLRGGAQRLVGVQPDAAAALRRAVEGSVLQRSAGAHRSNPDLFGLPAGGSPKSAREGCSSPQRLRVGLRLQELRDEDGNRLCRSVHVTSCRPPPQDGVPSSSTLLQPTSSRRSTSTAQPPHSHHASTASIAYKGTGSQNVDSVDAGETCELSRTNPLASHSEGALCDAACTAKGGADRGDRSQDRLHGEHPYLRSSVAGSSVLETPSHTTVAAHPVDFEISASGCSAHGQYSQANIGSSSILSEAQISYKTTNTPTSTTADEAELDCDNVWGNMLTRHDGAAEVQTGVSALYADTNAEPCRSKSSAEKQPSGAVRSANRYEGRHTSSQPTTKTNEKQGDQKRPLVFLHGVGFGVLPYLGWVWKLLTAFPDRPFLLLEVRHVSLRLCMHAVGVDDVVRVLSAVLQRHGIQQANFIGHSFGTFVVAHMRKLFPETVSSVLLCDPVCMLTCFPKLLYNFIYRGVSFRDLVDDPVEMARWLVARDLCIASTFCRHFFWHTLMLWPWELPDATVLVLSTRDALVPSELVKKQLENGLKGARAHKVRVLEKELHHGYFLFLPKWQDTIIKTYKEAVDDAEAVCEVPARRQRRRSSNGVQDTRNKRAEAHQILRKDNQPGDVEKGR